MDYFNTRLGRVQTEAELRLQGVVMQPDVLSALGLFPVEYPEPQHDPTYYTLEPSGSPHPKDGDSTRYVQDFSVVPRELSTAKAVKLAELSAVFDQAQATGHTLSVCGFEVDANETADRNVRGLITKLEATGAPSTPFCDYTNTMRQATLAQLKTIQLEIIGYGEALYARKWALREAVNSAEAVDDVVAVTVSFDGVGA